MLTIKYAVAKKDIVYETEPIITIDNVPYKEMIKAIAVEFKQDPRLISKIIFCESGYKIQSHDGGRAKNITGIWDTTFKGWLPLYEKEIGKTLDIKNQTDQVRMMSFVFSKDESYRKQWTSYVAYKKGGKYIFTNKGKTYTSHCK